MQAMELLCALGVGMTLGAGQAGVKAEKGYDIYAESANPEKISEKVVFTSRIHEPGVPLKYSAWLMDGTDRTNAPVYVMMEYDEKRTRPPMEKAVAEGLMPPGLVVFVAMDSLQPTLKGGYPRYMRGELMGNFSRRFPSILADEVIPAAAEKVGVAVSSDPDFHFISGSSAGGGATLNALWRRNDYFHRGYASSPVADSQLISLIRLTEAKPMRVYLTVGDSEPDRVNGDLFYGDLAYRAAFDYAGYPCEMAYYPKGGHTSGKDDLALLGRMFAFVWKGWRTERIVPKRNPIRIDDLVVPGGWTEVAEPIPPMKRTVKAAGGAYSFEGGKILFAKDGVTRVAADGFRRISGLSLSSDLWRLYVIDADSRYVRALAVSPDGSLGHACHHAAVEIETEASRLGAFDILTLEDDRLLLATELGVQGVLSFGVLDLILPLPENLPAERLWMEDQTLFAASGNRVFRRGLKRVAASEGKPSRPSADYYSITGENRNSTHIGQLAPDFQPGTFVVITNRIAR